MKSVKDSASRYTVFFLIFVMIIGFQPISVYADADWLAGWDYRKSHTITGSVDGAQIDYQVGIFVYKGNGADGSITIGHTTFGKVYSETHCQDNFGDVNFTKADGVTALDYWIEYYSSADYAIFWVKVDSIPESPSTVDIYIYYGTEGATTTSSSMADTWTDSLDWTSNLIGSFTKYEPAGGAADYEDTWLTPTDAEYPARLIVKRAVTDLWDYDKYGFMTKICTNEDADDVRDSTEDLVVDISDDTDHGASAVNAAYRLYHSPAYDLDISSVTLELYLINDWIIVAETSVSSDWFQEGRAVLKCQEINADAPTSMNYWGYSYGSGGSINMETFSYDAVNDVIEWGGRRGGDGQHYEKSPWMVIGKFTPNEPEHTSWGEEEEKAADAIINIEIVASDITPDESQWFFLNASIEVQLNTSIFLFNRIDIDPDGLNMSCSYTNSTGFLEENDPNNYLQLDVVVSVKTDLNNTFVRVDYYLRIHSNVTKDGVYNVTVYSSASGGLNDTDTYIDVFNLTIRTPSAPTKLFGAGFNASSPFVELHWTHDLLIYTVFEVQNSSNKVDWAYLGENSTAQYTDNQVVNGTERYYRVRACRNTGVGWKNTTFTDIDFETVYFIMTGAGGISYVNVYRPEGWVLTIMIAAIGVPLIILGTRRRRR